MKLLLTLSIIFATVLQAATLVWPPTFQGSVNLPSQSHGSGYSPYANEFWVPLWADATVYRYDKNYNYLGTFATGQREMMQLWGDTDGSYYTANWGYNTITKKAGVSNSTTLWSYNIGSTAAAVTSDANYVYAMAWGSNVVHKLNKSTGALIGTLTLGNMTSNSTYGGLAVVDNYLIVGEYNGYIEYFSLATGAKLGSYYTGYNIYGSAFDGKNYYIHQNDSTTEIFTLATPSVPEPTSLLILGLAITGIFLRNKK